MFRGCSHENLLSDMHTGEVVCNLCGLVVDEQNIDQRPEWRSSTERKGSRSRVGRPLYYPITGNDLSTYIGFINLDASPSSKEQMLRLKRTHNRIVRLSSKDRSMTMAMVELNRIADRTYIPRSVRQEAVFLYRKASRKGLVRGRSIVCVVSAVLYAACREIGIPRSLHEISEASLASKKAVARCYRILFRELQFSTASVDPIIYLSKIAGLTKISGRMQGVATRILKEYKMKRGVVGKDPAGLAAAALYVACGLNREKRTQKEFAKAAGVTEVTVRTHCRALKKKLKLEYSIDRSICKG